MKNSLSIIFIIIISFAIACKSDEFTHEHSLTIVNNSDFGIEVRLYQKNTGTNFPISKDSFLLQPQSETTFYEQEYKDDYWEDLLCAPLDLDSLRFIIPNNLQVKKDIMDYRNWEDDSEGSSKNRKVQNCRFKIENDDLE